MRKEKSKRKGETIIGKVIYASLLFAPLISIAVTCLYTVINKNAYKSYYGETINQKQYNAINNIDNLILNNNYYFNNTSPTSDLLQETGTRIIIENLDNYEGDSQTIIDENKDNIKSLYFSNSGTTNGYIAFQTIDYTTIRAISLTNIFSFTFTFKGINKTTLDTLLKNRIFTITYNKYSYLDNAFEYGLYKVEQNNLYNWAKSTGTYNVVLATCQGIGITNTFTPMLLTYWFMISIIYFIYDIGLILIMILHRKIHEFEDTVL